MFYLVEKVFAGQSMLTLIGAAWAVSVAQPVMAGIMIVLWICSIIIYFEWRNSE